MIKKYLKTFVLALCAGICIGIGGTVYLMCSSKLLGAILFSVGLLTILIFKLKLFTGMSGYILEEKNKLNYILHLFITWLGNFVGTFLVGSMLLNTRLSDNLVLVAEVDEEKATNTQSITLKMYNDLNSVTINMAKNQMLALSPTKINGVCGRLLCCL